MIVDCHVNIWNKEHVLPAYYEQLGRIREQAISDQADADTIIEVLDGIDRAIVFTLRYGDTTGIEGEDRVTAEAVTRYPEKLVGFAYVDPRRPGYLEELEFAVQDLGLKGVKYGPIYNGVALDDPRMEPVYDYCIRHNLPLTMHMGTTYTRLHAADLGRPIHVEAVALRHPELKLVMAHMAHPWFEECVAVIRKQPNVYAEISAIYYRRWQFYNVMMAIQEYQAAAKVFFGSDYPYSTPSEGLQLTREVLQVGGVAGLPAVSPEIVEQIIHANPFEHWWHGGLDIDRG
ncbi:MAG: amidohydrolase family protein [Alphaproteobacteria bacterium]|nr:amidohydrolase [Rhodospirillaceae bacterium]MDP6403919.1 amidohydrolase family protein [Alphaproteobacteria bacterium]MDP6622893.1 amidohydrolase family protein [Alphaproteobacteria bacterium]